MKELLRALPANGILPSVTTTDFERRHDKEMSKQNDIRNNCDVDSSDDEESDADSIGY